MGLHESLLKEPVQNLALRQPVVCRSDATVRQAVQQMREQQLGCTVIVDDDHKPMGMFTESMLVQLLEKNPKAVDDPVSSHMSEQWPWVKLSDPIVDVLDAMQSKNVRFLCVVDDDGRVAALTGQKGLMEFVADHFPRQVMVQRVGLGPTTHCREGA